MLEYRDNEWLICTWADEGGVHYFAYGRTPTGLEARGFGTYGSEARLMPDAPALPQERLDSWIEQHFPHTMPG